MRLIGEAHRDPIPFKSPEFFDQAIVEFLPPLACEELDNGRPALQKFRAIAPPAIYGVRQRYLFRGATVPSIFGQSDFLDRCLASEGRERWTLNCFLWRIHFSLLRNRC